MLLEFQRADRMRDPLDGIRQRMRKIIHRIDAPFIARPVMMRMGNTIDDRITQDHVRCSHIDLGPQDLLPIAEFTRLHAGKQIQVFLNTAIAIGALFARFRERATVGLDLSSRQVIDISEPLPDEFYRIVIEFVEVIRSIEHAVLPGKAQPMDIRLDRINIFRILFRRIRIIETQIAQAMIVLSQTKIQANGLGMADMKITIRLRREPRMDTLCILPVLQIFFNRILNKVRSNRRVFCHVILSFITSRGLWPHISAQYRF